MTAKIDLPAVKYREPYRQVQFASARSDIMGLVFRHGLALTATGILIGVGGALFLTRMLSSLLFHVSPLDVVSFSSSIALLGLISIVAFVVPARRAASIDPMRTLRSE